jgi:hypothetical protein
MYVGPEVEGDTNSQSCGAVMTNKAKLPMSFINYLHLKQSKDDISLFYLLLFFFDSFPNTRI